MLPNYFVLMIHPVYFCMGMEFLVRNKDNFAKNKIVIFCTVLVIGILNFFKFLTFTIEEDGLSLLEKG